MVTTTTKKRSRARTSKSEPLKITRDMALDLLSQMPAEELLSQLSDEDPFLWIYQNVPTENERKLDFSRRPYLVQILRDYSQHIAYKKSAQVGITMCGGIAKCLYAVDKLGINSIYTFPTARDVGEFSKGRFRYIIRNSRYLHSKVGDVDNQGLVRIGKSVIYFRGTNSKRQAISVPSDLNIHDELNFSDPTVRATFSSRLDASEFEYNGEMQYGWEWDFSTPTLPRYGISAIYEDSDKHEWWVRCTGCRRVQRVDFFKNKRKSRKGRWFFGCRKCDKELDRTKGEWVARNPGASIRGYHITQPMCAFIQAEKMVKQYTKAIKTPEGKRTFYNFNLGLDYEDGSEAITRGLVLSRVVEGTAVMGDIYMGVDQGDLLHVEVTKMVDGVRRIIWIDTVKSFEELGRMIDHYKPRIAVVDALPNHHNAMALSKSRHNVYICYYSGTNKLEKEYWKKDLEEKEVKVPKHDVLDRTASDWHMSRVLIENYIEPRLIEEFANQMAGSKRSYVENSKGEKEVKWVAVDDDHFRHADTYNWIATEIGNSSFSEKLVLSSPDPQLAVVESIFQEGDSW